MSVNYKHGKIGRSLWYTRIIGLCSLGDFDITVRGNFRDFESASRAAQKYLGTKQTLVKELHHGKSFANCTIDAFLTVAEETSVDWED